MKFFATANLNTSLYSAACQIKRTCSQLCCVKYLVYWLSCFITA